VVVGDEQRLLRDLTNLKYLFGDKWAPAIVVALTRGRMRRVEILSTVNSYSIYENWSNKRVILHDSILTRTLKKMTKEGLLVRTESTVSFPREVYYSLTPVVAELLSAIEPAVEWARRNPELIAAAQAYTRHHGGTG
jgi:DNA-binding HxlR family transcriptional regulator